MAKDPGGVADGSKRICANNVVLAFSVTVWMPRKHLPVGSFRLPPLTGTNIPKVGGLQTRRSRLVNVQYVLEMFVEGIEQAVTKAPEKEEDGDQADGEN